MSEEVPMEGSLPSLEEARAWVGYRVEGIEGARVGRVRGLFADAGSGEPTWLIAALGRRASQLVAIPLRACAAAAGSVWVVHGRETIRSAPTVDPTRPLLREHELAICAHFGIGERVGRAAEVAGRAEGALTSRPAL